MATVVTMPQLGESVVEGTVARWLKSEGDRIEKYEPLVEVITEKVNVEVPSPTAGVIARITVAEGSTVSVGTEIAVIEEAAAKAAPSRALPVAVAVAGNGASAAAPSPAAPQQRSAPWPADNGSQHPQAPAESPRRYTPVVLRMAETHHLDLERVSGTGTGGRVTKDDVLRFLEEQQTAAAAAPAKESFAAAAIQSAMEPPATAAPPHNGKTALPPTVERAAPPAPQAAERPAPAPQMPPLSSPDEEVMALTPMRRAIAENMAKSAATIPAAWCTVEVDVTGLVRLRERIKAEVSRRHGVDLTYLPFAALATVEALREFPTVNSTWAGDHIVLKKRINLGLAVSLPDGLLVPVIRGADGMNLLGLARACADLIGRARQGGLTPDDMQGAAFTLNNTGALGSVISRGIVPPGQAGILNVEAIVKRPVVRDDAIAVRSMLNLCLSFDHRILDGREALGFLQAIRRRLEAWQAGDSPL